jgi:hypothetical protein
MPHTVCCLHVFADPACCRAQSRRAAMGVLAGAAALAAGAAPSQAAYGDAANVFGKVTNKSGACD